jgi:hypothetical protein
MPQHRLHGPQNHAIVARTVMRAVQAAAQRNGVRQAALTGDCDDDAVCEIGQGGGRKDKVEQDSLDKLEDELYEKKQKLRKEQDAQQEKVDEIEKKFLESKAGKAAKKEIDRLEKEKQKQHKKAIEERNKRQGENCCGRAELAKWQSWLNDQNRKIQDAFDKARNKILDREIRKANPKQAKARDKAKQDVKDTQKKIDAVRAKMERINKIRDARRRAGSGVVEP